MSARDEYLSDLAAEYRYEMQAAREPDHDGPDPEGPTYNNGCDQCYCDPTTGWVDLCCAREGTTP